MTRPTALVTGVTGQDGVYLSRLLLSRGYRVVGTTRRSAHAAKEQLELLGIADAEVRTARDGASEDLHALLRDVRPHEIYHLAAQSVVHASWERAVETAEVTAIGALRMLEGVRTHCPEARVLMASSSEIFGEPSEWPQTETTSVQPRSPYGAAKAFAYWMTSSYRQVHSVWAASAILYNHESPLRSEEFVTRKITRGVAAIVAGKATELRLGNLEARRDWGHASDYVEAMWRMLQCEAAEDFIIGSGESHSVREFCELAFSTAGLDYRDHVVQDERLFRPADAFTRVADSSLAAQKLNWRPTYTFEALVREMTRADLARVNRPAG